MAMNEIEDGGDSGQSMDQYAALISAGLLVTGGMLAVLVMALKRVRNILLWAIPVSLVGAGIALSIKPLQERQARIDDVQEQIGALLDQLDPVAKAELALRVAEEELR